MPSFDDEPRLTFRNVFDSLGPVSGEASSEQRAREGEASSSSFHAARTTFRFDLASIGTIVPEGGDGEGEGETNKSVQYVRETRIRCLGCCVLPSIVNRVFWIVVLTVVSLVCFTFGALFLSGLLSFSPLPHLSLIHI